MSNFNNRIIFIVIVLLCVLQSPVPATEIDMDVRDIIGRETEIKKHDGFINKDKIYLNELREALEDALLADDQQKFQNVYRVLSLKLKHLQEMLTMQDERIEQYRFHLFRSLYKAKPQKTYFEEPLYDERFREIASSIYEQISSEEDKTAIGSQLIKVVNARKALEKLNAMSDKIPESPYGSPRGLDIKHKIAALNRIRIDIEKAQCVRLEGIAKSLMGTYISKRLASEKIVETDYTSLLDSFISITDTLMPEAGPVDNPYLQRE